MADNIKATVKNSGTKATRATLSNDSTVTSSVNDTVESLQSTVRDNSSPRATLKRERQINVAPYFVINSGNGIRDIQDVEIGANSLLDGSLLVYENQSQRWKPTVNLYKQDIDAGEF